MGQIRIRKRKERHQTREENTDMEEESSSQNTGEI
jgi:hypothetical protein